MVTLFLTILACSDSQQSIIVYSGRSEKNVGKLLSDAEKELGFKIEVQYGKTSDVVNRIIVEGDQGMADVVFAQDSGHLGVLAEKNLLLPLDQELRDSVDQAFQDEKGLIFVFTIVPGNILTFDLCYFHVNVIYLTNHFWGEVSGYFG